MVALLLPMLPGWLAGTRPEGPGTPCALLPLRGWWGVSLACSGGGANTRAVFRPAGLNPMFHQGFRQAAVKDQQSVIQTYLIKRGKVG